MAKNRIPWLLKNKLINLIVSCDGIVFGGAARDKYLHDMHATKFFSHLKTVRDRSRKNVRKLYEDHTYLPELHGRFVCPYDIDAYIHCDKSENLLTEIKKHFPTAIKIFERDPLTYFPDMQVCPGTLTHYRYSLSAVSQEAIRNWVVSLDNVLPYECLQDDGYKFKKKVNSTIQRLVSKCNMPICLDLLVFNGTNVIMPDPPFGHGDFKCNMLILDKSGFRLSNFYNEHEHTYTYTDPVSKLLALQEVLKQVEERRAEVITIKWYRVKKMLKRGWNVQGIFKHIERVKNTSSYEGHCIICHGSLSDADEVEGMVIPHMKLKCCDGRYHPACLLQAITNGTHSMSERSACPHCSRSIPWISVDGAKLSEFIDNYIHIL